MKGCDCIWRLCDGAQCHHSLSHRAETEQRHVMAFVPSPSEDQPCQFLLHLGDWIHLTDWTRTLKSYPLLMSPRIVWTSVPPRPTPPALVLLEKVVCRTSVSRRLSESAQTPIHHQGCVKNCLPFLFECSSTVWRL